MEDKLNMTIQVLKNNSKVLGELTDFYSSLELPDRIKNNCQRETAKFLKRVTDSIGDLEMHRSRAETLLRLLADRKMLVSAFILPSCKHLKHALIFTRP